MIYQNAGNRQRLEHSNIKSFYFLVGFAVITLFLNGCNKSPADMYSLGVQSEQGKGVSQDYAKAREWYQKAADAGDANHGLLLSQLAVCRSAAAQMDRHWSQTKAQ